LERLSDGGRLILPLTTDASFQATSSGKFDVAQMAKRGAVFRIQRRGTDFDVRWLFPAAYILAEGVRDPESEAALANAFQIGDPKKVTRLYRTDDLPAERCWLQGRGWCLAYG
jgi:protein-L-isoaspartate(D-aspartate) O-methyltransferase